MSILFFRFLVKVDNDLFICRDGINAVSNEKQTMTRC